MLVQITGRRPVQGVGTEYQLLLEDADTGRISPYILLSLGSSTLRIIRVNVIDPSRPMSGVSLTSDGTIDVRQNAIYVNRPMRGSTLAIVLDLRWGPIAEQVAFVAEKMTVIERVAELTSKVDETPGIDENPTDAQGQPSRRRTT